MATTKKEPAKKAGGKAKKKATTKKEPAKKAGGKAKKKATKKKAAAKKASAVGGPKQEAQDHKRYATADGPVAADGTPLPGHKNHGKQAASSRPMGADWPKDTGDDQDDTGPGPEGSPHPDHDDGTQQLAGCETKKAPRVWESTRKYGGDRNTEDGENVTVRVKIKETTEGETESLAALAARKRFDERMTLEQFVEKYGPFDRLEDVDTKTREKKPTKTT